MTHKDDAARDEPVQDGRSLGYEPPRVDPLGTIGELTLGSEAGSGSDGTFTGSIL